VKALKGLPTRVRLGNDCLQYIVLKTLAYHENTPYSGHRNALPTLRKSLGKRLQKLSFLPIVDQQIITEFFQHNILYPDIQIQVVIGCHRCKAEVKSIDSGSIDSPLTPNYILGIDLCDMRGYAFRVCSQD
jgi:hypothetical protein